MSVTLDNSNADATATRRARYLARLREITQSIESQKPEDAPQFNDGAPANPTPPVRARVVEMKRPASPPVAPPVNGAVTAPAVKAAAAAATIAEAAAATTMAQAAEPPAPAATPAPSTPAPTAAPAVAKVAEPSPTPKITVPKAVTKAAVKASSDDLTILAGDLAPKFAEAFVVMVRQIHDSETSRKRKRDSVLEALNQVSARIETLGREMDFICQQAGRALQGTEELSSKLKVIDDRLKEHERAVLNLQQQSRQVAQELKTQQEATGQRVGDTVAKVAQVGERLEMQAKVIRGLHDIVRSQGQRREELRNTLQMLGEIAGRLSFDPLPAKL